MNVHLKKCYAFSRDANAQTKKSQVMITQMQAKISVHAVVLKDANALHTHSKPLLEQSIGKASAFINNRTDVSE